jgi:hypothetical protein
MKQGRLVVDKLTGRIFDGAISGTATVDTASTVPRVVTRFKLQGLNSRKVVGLLTGEDRLKGPVTVAGEIRANGVSEAALVSSLSGEVSVSGQVQVILRREEKAAVGAAKITNLAAALFGGKVRELRQLTPAAQLVVALDRTLGSSAARLSGKFTIVDGVARTENLDLVGPGGRALTNGTIDLPRWRLATLTRVFDRAGGEPLLSVELSGPIDAPERGKIGGRLIKGARTAVKKAPARVLEKMLPNLLGRKPAKPEPQSPQPQPPTKIKPKDVLRGVLEGLIR